MLPSESLRSEHEAADPEPCTCRWTRNQFATGIQPVLPKLLWMDVANNMLSGKVPDFGDLNLPPYFISNGALLRSPAFLVCSAKKAHPCSNANCASILGCSKAAGHGCSMTSMLMKAGTVAAEALEALRNKRKQAWLSSKCRAISHRQCMSKSGNTT